MTSSTERFATFSPFVEAFVNYGERVQLQGCEIALDLERERFRSYLPVPRFSSRESFEVWGNEFAHALNVARHSAQIGLLCLRQIVPEQFKSVLMKLPDNTPFEAYIDALARQQFPSSNHLFWGTALREDTPCQTIRLAVDVTRSRLFGFTRLCNRYKVKWHLDDNEVMLIMLGLLPRDIQPQMKSLDIRTIQEWFQQLKKFDRRVKIPRGPSQDQIESQQLAEAHRILINLNQKREARLQRRRAQRRESPFLKFIVPDLRKAIAKGEIDPQDVPKYMMKHVKRGLY